MLTTRVNLADGVNEGLERSAFQQVATHASSQSALNLEVPFEGSENDDLGFGKLSANRGHRIVATHVGQPQIHQGNVGQHAPELGDSLPCRHGAADDLYV